MKSTILAGVIFFALFSTAEAQNHTFGNWVTATTNAGDAIYATTMNDSGNMLGQFCFLASDSCIWMIAVNLGCKDGERYPVLANSDVAANHLMVQCNGRLDNGLYSYAFTNFDQINDIVLRGMRVGFAVPLERDNFRVIRFDLRHSNQAIAAMRAEAQRNDRNNRPTSRNTGTRDLEL